MRLRQCLGPILALGCGVMAISSSPASGQWLPEGTPIAPGVGSGQTIPIPASNSQEGLYVAWRDRRSGDGDVYLQHLTAEGYFAPGWFPTGRLIATGPTSQTALGAAPDGKGGVLVSWIDLRPGGYDVWAQRVGPDGLISPGWTEGGVLVAGGAGYQTLEDFMPDGSGGAYVAWRDDDGASGTRVPNAHLQHLDAQGQVAPGWGPSGTPILPTPGSHGTSRLVNDGADGCLAIVAEHGGSLPGTPQGRGTNHAAMRFLASGDRHPDWPVNGTLLLRTLSAVELRRACSDGAGGAYFAWNDNRFSPDPANPFYYDIYAQHVLPDGRIDPRWPADGLPVAFGPGGQYDFDLVGDGDGGFFLLWSDSREGPWLLFAQRILPDASVAPKWPADGLRLTTNVIYELEPRMTADGLGGFFAFWAMSPEGEENIYHLHVGRDAKPIPGWTQDGRLLATDADNANPIADGAHGALVALERTGDGPGVWAQRVYGDVPTSTLPTIVSAVFADNAIRLRWYCSKAFLGVRVERRDESSDWAQVGIPTTLSPSFLEYSDTDLTADRYAYRLSYENGGRVEHSTETWVEVQRHPSFALRGFHPNPSSGNPLLSFTLPDDRPARIDLIDVKGRVVHSREVGSLGGGSHVLPLADETPLGAGMYWIRLTHPERTLTTKGLVVR